MKIKVITTLESEFYINLPENYRKLVEKKEVAFYLFSSCP